ncbi:bifunctional DNA-formamidopyrimidine glycosylase/DNA-(apurinic or apyrimidinic site) lyase [Metasolibacillus meyeri]|uniref:Bifunctional DNA-formamidopyrimidine glycosylase/DNA-(Apurinic or apyrimidinic site) lyase n=1 Tax=Metasolibacillus meyeri TaxID=1071052 RepID=A0AAW9NYA8_9BACL|nr:bifunctional DNA-formamidopyrimidine glycosylase/DNA-(apurinic or apyrimidinic site) lyase [Metasolibacillus meyeri]MEC1180416.1 bifunctional DNA-formamidopyrimidine glycosylase/DNA-(apurinic or apyrimidinic site) lyase [Metasolibacillus meyeri]
MPELPEVEGVVKDLKPLVEGKTIQSVTLSNTVYTSHAAGKQTIVKGGALEWFETSVQQMTIAAIERRAKYIFIHLKKDGEPFVLVNHLGMTGAWFVVQNTAEIAEEKFRKHIHATFILASGELLVYSDIRRFGELRFLRTIEEHAPLTKMAPEPFDATACEFFLAQCTKSKYENKTIKEVIMDGQVISGCGNIYATEALFATKISPTQKVKAISKVKKMELFQAIVNVLQESIDNGGSTISDYRTVNGGAGSMQNRLKMYGHKQCPLCQSATESVVIAGRTSTYCPSCQK